MVAVRRKAEEYPTAAAFLPARRSLPALRTTATTCRGCPLYKYATQTVFGEGGAKAVAIFVGEQPGDQEDLAGRPFVGPAGRLLRDMMTEAGIDSRDVYITNAVKHFKFEPRGKKRLHAKPKANEIQACRPWLEAELQAIEPDVLVCMGATAVQSLLGSSVKVLRDRGKWLQHPAAAHVMVTIHPSALLRIPDHEERVAARAVFQQELREIAARIAMAKHGSSKR